MGKANLLVFGDKCPLVFDSNQVIHAHEAALLAGQETVVSQAHLIQNFYVQLDNVDRFAHGCALH